MVLYTKCILSSPLPEDGLRVSVMSSHTLDGKVADPRITSDKFDHHELILAPPLKLIGAYFRGDLNWDQYVKEYLRHIRTKKVSPHVEDYANRAAKEDITFLCIEENATNCHRSILAKECLRYNPNLEVLHRVWTR